MITTISELAALINNSDEFPIKEFNEAIKKNRWHDDTGDSTWGICHSDYEKLTFTENLEAIVTELSYYLGDECAQAV